ncbi:Transcriptional activator protein UGA3 [Sphaceloma murrayae]|uniref:Transcriptional activator protein UGA3 n=1 Tax=Sphaceloma murrayae TaxID=2082308 RepID=A0A2K1R2P7_9PEZI|nr:Transcriptional activator protein UGA3 [Sphaceloma murrayae]
MTSRRRDSEHRQKIRESCNSCSAQKIRCGKQRPACARCVTKGIDCNYSFSQRTGRRAPSAANAANTTQQQPSSLPQTTSSSSTTTSSTPVAAFAPPATPASDCDPFVAVRSGSISDQSVIQPLGPMEGHCGDPLSFDTGANPFKDADVFQDFNSGMSLDFLWSPTTESTTLSNMDTTTNPHSAGMLSGYSQQHDWRGMPASTDTSTSTSPGLTHDFPASRQNSIRPHCRGQDCLALALQVVFDLHVARDACSTAASDMMNFNQSHEEARDVDQVLFLNRDAIKSINKILDCPCSSDPSVSLACYLATNKIVSWYAAAIGVSDGQPDHLDETQTMSDRIIARPIFMGRYCLDAEAQRSVRAKVVLTELREHIQPLLAKLPKHQVSSFGRPEHGSTLPLSASSLPKDNDGQPCALRSQIRRIIREAGNINKAVL